MSVIDYTAVVTIRQRFENLEQDLMEAVYEFPVDARVLSHTQGIDHSRYYFVIASNLVFYLCISSRG